MNRVRAKVVARGVVQGVGFRPFVYRLASEMGVRGSVLNSSQGVFIDIEGERDSVQRFLLRLEKEKPPRAVIQSLESSFRDPVGYEGFEILYSEDEGEKTVLISPDIATCRDCLKDIFDPKNRRFRYPFTNCTNCGPRFSIIESLPYDRGNTSMKRFVMCQECEAEYHDPLDRRFHAQPNACPKCGPQLQLWDANGELMCGGDTAFCEAAAAVRAGKILALKGIGGFQLVVDARLQTAVARLRQRKHRQEKPFAVMCPSLQAAQTLCAIAELEKRLLCSPESPIVLLQRRNKADVIAGSVAPGNPNLGIMLPYTPLHHLLLRDLDFAIVATSGNLSDEPICIDEHEAIERLRGIADVFLVHNRPILRHVDDSIARIMCGREIVLRRARGYAPLPVSLAFADRSSPLTTLAVGAHLKNTVALGLGDNAFISQHIGDLETKEAYAAFCRAAQDLPRLYEAKVGLVAYDLHPDYLSTKYATQLPEQKIAVQHHWAHVAACMAENEIGVPALGVSWDGTGYGLDGSIWGGEFLFANENGFARIAHLRQFRLPGGDAAIKEPRRSAVGVLYEVFGQEWWKLAESNFDLDKNESALLTQMLAKNINAPLTSSAGRLFDAVASLTGLRQRSSFEGQAAMELEFGCEAGVPDAYPFRVNDTRPMVIDWEPAIRILLNDVAAGEATSVISAKFHNTLVGMIIAIAQKIHEEKVVLTGGCFQNRYLTEHAVDRLRTEKFRPYWHQRIPPNDGGISLGQCVAATWARRDLGL